MPDAQVDDGLLDVVLTHDRPRIEFLRGLGKVFKGAHVHEPGFELLRGREVHDQRRPAVPRLRGRRPGRADCRLSARVVPGALRVITR